MFLTTPLVFAWEPEPKGGAYVLRGRQERRWNENGPTIPFCYFVDPAVSGAWQGAGRLEGDIIIRTEIFDAAVGAQVQLE